MGEDPSHQPQAKRRRAEETRPQRACAESGVLERVTVKNFMCHDHLEFNFSPNVNFIQGRNGSGKSAIMAAVVVGLGASSRTTNRGNSLKDLVKHGKSVATVQIVVKNRGKDAYKPDAFGESVIVERKISDSGPGGYKLKSANGVVVSTKREELTRILDHFNLQVDNPLTVLNQDMSRTFLSSSDPDNLYKFFLKSTLLQDIKECYFQFENSINESAAIIQDRKSVLPEIENEEKQLRRRFEQSKGQADNRSKLREIQKELAWATVREMEEEEQAALAKLQQLEAQCQKCDAKLAGYEATNQREVDENKSQEEEKNRIVEKMGEASKQYKVINQSQQQARAKMKEKQLQLSSAEKKIKGLEAEIKQLQTVIEKDHVEAQRVWAAKREERLEKINKALREINDINHDLKTEETHSNNLRNTIEKKKAEERQMFLEEKAAQNKCQGIQREVQELKGQRNSVTVFGQWVPRLLQEIDEAHRRRQFTAKPVGPIGAYIKLRDHKWGHVVEEILGKFLRAFCVNNKKDYATLKSILSRMNIPQHQAPTIIVSKFREQVHDVSRFEVVSDQYPSLWSVLDVTNTVVANTLIDQLQVEATLLIPTAQEAGRILSDHRTVPRNCNVAYTLNRDIYHPDPNFRIYSGRGQQPARFLQVSVEQKIQGLEEELAGVRQELAAMGERSSEAQREVRVLEGELSASTRKIHSCKNSMRKLQAQKTELEYQEDPVPPNVSQLEDDVRMLEASRDRELDVVKRLREASELCRQEYQDAAAKADALKKEQEQIMKELDAVKENISAYETKTNEVKHKIAIFNKKKKEINSKKKDLDKEVKAATKKREDNTKIAETISPRIDTRRSRKELKSQYEALNARLKEIEKENGDPLEIGRKFKEVHDRCQRIKKELDSHSNLIERLKAALEQRRDQYSSYRRFLSVLIGSKFRRYTSFRKLHGKLDFDFDKEKLHMYIMKDTGDDTTSTHMAASRGKRQQSLQMMSGGERSYCTVSFIQAFWSAIHSPVRMLDEFDVFMDVIARKQSMRLMIQSADELTQYIYLTPLDLNTIDLPAVSLFRMPDPERKEEDS